MFPGEDLELDRLFEEHVESPIMQPDNPEQYVTEEKLNFEFTIASGDEESSIQPDSQHLPPDMGGKGGAQTIYRITVVKSVNVMSALFYS